MKGGQSGSFNWLLAFPCSWCLFEKSLSGVINAMRCRQIWLVCGLICLLKNWEVNYFCTGQWGGWLYIWRHFFVRVFLSFTTKSHQFCVCRMAGMTVHKNIFCCLLQLCIPKVIKRKVSSITFFPPFLEKTEACKRGGIYSGQ